MTNCLLQVKEGTALARWVFLNPCCIVTVNEYAKKEFKQCQQGFDKCTKDGCDMFDTFLSQADVAKLSKFLYSTFYCFFGIDFWYILVP